MKKLDDLPPDTERLAFREWNGDDLDRFHAICSDSQVMQFVGDGQAWAKKRTGEFIQSATVMLRENGYCQCPSSPPGRRVQEFWQQIMLLGYTSIRPRWEPDETPNGGPRNKSSRTAIE
jgi:RimJ/RimL family protein N-acetyltransferase